MWVPHVGMSLFFYGQMRTWFLFGPRCYGVQGFILGGEVCRALLKATGCPGV